MAYLLQALLIGIFWLGYHTHLPLRAAVQYPGIPSLAFEAFLLPDAVLVVGASIARAYSERKELAWIVLGSVGFGTLWCVQASWLSGGGLLPTSLMVLALGYNCFLVFGRGVFRNASTSSRWVNGWKTAGQIVGVWGITLVLFPAILLTAFDAWPQTIPAWRLALAAALFLLASSFGIAGAYVMVRDGEGTPLPLDQTQKLVVRGPYRYVRNPMALAGVGQGTALALGMGSWILLAYALLGAVVWHVAVRPAEEANLVARFGEAYVRYRERIGLWWPRCLR